MEKLEIVLKEIEDHIQFHEQVNQSISQVSVGWQLEHLMLVINNVVATMKNSDPKAYKFVYKPVRLYVMLKGKIPRGKGKAPKGVVPPEEEKRTIENLKAQLAITRNSIQKLTKLHKKQFFKHPLFGNMRRNAAIKFLGIHSNHHLAIVKDILG